MTDSLAPDASHADATEQHDRACLQAVVGRDRAAFERLYRQQHPRLARFLRRFTARHDLIDDVINDAMWVVWRNAAAFRGGSKVSTWIIGIAYRCMLKALRATAPQEELGEVALDDAQTHALANAQTDSADEREQRDWLARGLRLLPDDQRVTLELSYFMGQSCEEIALVMGCAVGTVKARMFHARVRLRNSLPALGGRAAADPGSTSGRAAVDPESREG